MHRSVRMSADRLSQLMAINEADITEAKETGQREWLQCLLRRRASLAKIEDRMMGALAASPEFSRTR